MKDFMWWVYLTSDDPVQQKLATDYIYLSACVVGGIVILILVWNIVKMLRK